MSLAAAAWLDPYPCNLEQTPACQAWRSLRSLLWQLTPASPQDNSDTRMPDLVPSKHHHGATKQELQRLSAVLEAFQVSGALHS